MPSTEIIGADLFMSITELNSQRERLKELRVAHRELDLQIIDLGLQPYQDNLLIRRLKKRKLQLNDTIVKLESELIPDLNAW